MRCRVTIHGRNIDFSFALNIATLELTLAVQFLLTPFRAACSGHKLAKPLIRGEVSESCKSLRMSRGSHSNRLLWSYESLSRQLVTFFAEGPIAMQRSTIRHRLLW